MTGPARHTAHLALVGPTASGKSALALAVAEALGDVEIVTVDSMQVYRGMDVGTAKPTVEERSRVPHHLVDVADPWEEWTVVRFRDEVRRAVGAVESRRRRALLTGGTGLYLRAVIDPLDFPPEDRRVRQAIEAEAEAEGLEGLFAELQAADPVAASRIDPANTRRIVRAVEVVRLTGRPFSSFGPGLAEYGDPVFPLDIHGLRLRRETLAARIGARLHEMVDAGLVDEARRLLDDPRGLSRTARQAIGYREVADHLAGRWSLEDALAAAEARTLEFARRQIKWFERDPRIVWHDVEKPDDALNALLESWSPCPASA